MKLIFKILIICVFVHISAIRVNAQLIFNQESFYGGTTGAGFSTSLSTGSGSFDIHIEPNSTVKRAWLFSQRQGFPQPDTVILNGSTYIFDTSMVVSSAPIVGSFSTCSPIAIDVIEITDNIDSSITTYNVTMPPTINPPQPPCWGRSAIFLLVLYENSSLGLHNSIVLLNNISPLTNTGYNLNPINPVDTTRDIGWSIFSDRIGDTTGDGSRVFIEGNMIGLLGGTDNVNNIFSGGGVKGHFYYQNDSLFGLDDDTPDSLVSGTDGLADISSYLSNGSSSLGFSMQMQSMNNSTNYYGSYFITYSTPCDTFSTTITQDDTICHWDSKQLQATGGVQYSWYSLNGSLDDTTLANPTVQPGGESAYYMCTITNSLGCVKTEQVRVYVKNCVGLEDLDSDYNVNIYPNPTNGQINIESEKVIREIEIFDLIGKRVYYEVFSDSYVNFNPNLMEGVYLLRVKTEKGVLNRRIVVN